MKRHVERLWADRRRLGYWWIVGTAFTLLNLPVLYVLVDLMGVPLAVATLVAGEAGLLARFLVNDRWVFGHRRPTRRRLWQYHLAVAGGFVIWWSATNLLSRTGIHYLVAALLATGASVMLSVATNFLWVWCHKPELNSSSG
jgi:dolichol-phosphate mannosyltransferase